MNIKVIIEMEENGETFRIMSRPHESITEAFAEVASAAESQRRLIKHINRYGYQT